MNVDVDVGLDIVVVAVVVVLVVVVVADVVVVVVVFVVVVGVSVGVGIRSSIGDSVDVVAMAVSVVVAVSLDVMCGSVRRIFLVLECLAHATIFLFTWTVQAWPEEALASVAKYFLSGQAGLGIEPFIDPLGAMAVGIHRAVERETTR